MSTNVNLDTVVTHAWRLEHKQGSHFKFYEIYMLESGHVVYRWGRIGTNGATKHIPCETYEQADLVGMKQVYAKLSRGYEVTRRDHQFTVPRFEHVIPSQLAIAWDRAMRHGEMTSASTATLRHYDDFATRAQQFMKALDSPSEDITVLLAGLNDLEGAWAEIDTKHETVKTIVDLARQMFSQRLMGG